MSNLICNLFKWRFWVDKSLIEQLALRLRGVGILVFLQNIYISALALTTYAQVEYLLYSLNVVVKGLSANGSPGLSLSDEFAH